MMSSLPLGKFQPSTRVSTATPSGWVRAASWPGSPSHDMNHRSPCDAAMEPWSGWANRSPAGSVPSPLVRHGLVGSVVAAEHGTRASSGHAPKSVGSAEEKIGRTSVPLLVPAVLLKNPPAVSPAKPLTDLSPASMMPAMLMPDPKTY